MAYKKINNRDIPLLFCVLYTMQDIRMLEEKRDFTHEQLKRATKGLTGMPPGGGGPHGMEETFAKLAELDEQHAEKIKQYAEELSMAEKIINGIPPERGMRTFVEMVYMKHMRKEEVMAEINLTEWEYRKARERIEKAESMAKVKWEWP